MILLSVMVIQIAVALSINLKLSSYTIYI